MKLSTYVKVSLAALSLVLLISAKRAAWPSDSVSWWATAEAITESIARDPVKSLLSINGVFAVGWTVFFGAAHAALGHLRSEEFHGALHRVLNGAVFKVCVEVFA